SAETGRSSRGSRRASGSGAEVTASRRRPPYPKPSRRRSPPHRDPRRQPGAALGLTAPLLSVTKSAKENQPPLPVGGGKPFAVQMLKRLLGDCRAPRIKAYSERNMSCS